MAKYFLTNKAVEDLAQIWNFTYDEWSEKQADQYYELLIGSFKKIALNPKIGKSYDDIDPEVFGAKAGKHVIFYREIKPTVVEILRILHQRMDLKSRLNE